MSLASELLKENPPEEWIWNVFDWNKGVYYYSDNLCPSVAQNKMEPDSIVLRNAETNEIVRKVLAYDADRGLVTRILVERNEFTDKFESFVDATGDEVAKTTERMYLKADGDSELAKLINRATEEALSKKSKS